jgi:hypothetical protein
MGRGNRPYRGTREVLLQSIYIILDKCQAVNAGNIFSWGVVLIATSMSARMACFDPKDETFSFCSFWLNLECAMYNPLCQKLLFHPLHEKDILGSPEATLFKTQKRAF